MTQPDGGAGHPWGHWLWDTEAVAGVTAGGGVGAVACCTAAAEPPVCEGAATTAGAGVVVTTTVIKIVTVIGVDVGLGGTRVAVGRAGIGVAVMTKGVWVGAGGKETWVAVTTQGVWVSWGEAGAGVAVTTTTAGVLAPQLQTRLRSRSKSRMKAYLMIASRGSKQVSYLFFYGIAARSLVEDGTVCIGFSRTIINLLCYGTACLQVAHTLIRIRSYHGEYRPIDSKRIEGFQ